MKKFKINKKKLALSFCLLLLIPLCTHFIVSCKSVSQSSNNTNTPIEKISTPIDPTDLFNPNDVPNKPINKPNNPIDSPNEPIKKPGNPTDNPNELINKPNNPIDNPNNLSFQDSYRNPPSLFIDKKSNQLLLNNDLLIKTTYDKNLFTNIQTKNLSFDDLNGTLSFDLIYNYKNIAKKSSFSYNNFRKILNSRKISLQYINNNLDSSKLNAYDFQNKTYSTKTEIDDFFKNIKRTKWFSYC